MLSLLEVTPVDLLEWFVKLLLSCLPLASCCLIGACCYHGSNAERRAKCSERMNDSCKCSCEKDENDVVLTTGAKIALFLLACISMYTTYLGIQGVIDGASAGSEFIRYDRLFPGSEMFCVEKTQSCSRRSRRLNNNNCEFSNDGVCDVPSYCSAGTDCTDCGDCSSSSSSSKSTDIDDDDDSDTTIQQSNDDNNPCYEIQCSPKSDYTRSECTVECQYAKNYGYSCSENSNDEELWNRGRNNCAYVSGSGTSLTCAEKKSNGRVVIDGRCKMPSSSTNSGDSGTLGTSGNSDNAGKGSLSSSSPSEKTGGTCCATNYYIANDTEAIYGYEKEDFQYCLHRDHTCGNLQWCADFANVVENGALAENVFLDSYADTLALIAVAGMAVMSCLECFAVFGDFATIAGYDRQNAKNRSEICGCCCSVCILITLLISGVVGFFSTVFEQECFTPWAHTMMKNTEDLMWAVTFGAIQLLLLLALKNCMNLIVMPRLFEELGTSAASEGLSRMFGCLR
jgi:hypothetical protein